MPYLVNKSGRFFSYEYGSGVSTINANLYTFTPTSTLSEGVIAITSTVVDLDSVSSDQFLASFTIDQTVPVTPTVNAVATPTTNSVQTITGTKDTNTSIWINGVEVVAIDASTNWSTDVNLSQGINNLTIVSKDCADNTSPSTAVMIDFNNTVPGQISLLVNVDAGGRNAQLDWQSYDEQANGGNIDYYTIYQSTTSFTDVTTAAAIATVISGTQVLDIQNITPVQTIYYAVVATDLTGLSDSQVTSVEALFVDTVPPEEPGYPNVTDSFANQINVSWAHSTDSVGDLANYKIYLDDVFITDIAKENNTYQFVGLNEDEKHVAKVSAIDDQGVESTGRTRDVYTWLQNPINLQAEPHDGRIVLSWDAYLQSGFWHVYHVYMSTTPFTDVNNATSIQNISSTSFEVTGLTNNTNYYFAVTTRNSHGDFNPMVTTVMQAPIQDTDGPIINLAR